MYDPDKPNGSRFTVLAASSIYRLYHSVAMLLPDGSVLVAGSEESTCDANCALYAPAFIQHQVRKRQPLKPWSPEVITTLLKMVSKYG